MLPARNRKDLEEIPEPARRKLEFVWLDDIDDALEAALEAPGARRASKTSPRAASLATAGVVAAPHGSLSRAAVGNGSARRRECRHAEPSPAALTDPLYDKPPFLDPLEGAGSEAASGARPSLDDVARDKLEALERRRLRRRLTITARTTATAAVTSPPPSSSPSAATITSASRSIPR